MNEPVIYIAPCLDSSGYAEAARNNIIALHTAGVELAVKPISFEQDRPTLCKTNDIIKELSNRDTTTAKIQIIHSTPEHYPKFVDKRYYNIGYGAWETNLLPPHWVPKINLLNEVWVPSQYNVECFKNSGVAIPIFCMPHAFNTEYKITNNSGVVQHKRKEDFAFYSIFQWLERKNPVGLLRAYLTEFKDTENVVLVLKTFRAVHNSQDDILSIKKMIQDIKKELYLPSYPRMLMISSLLTTDEMLTLHRECNAYVSLHKSEGFGIPLVEAMLAGNPVIATNYSGNVDFMSEETGYLVKNTLTPVAGMPWPLYQGNMIWTEPDLLDARKRMREVFEHQEEAKKKAELAKKWIETNLSWSKVGHMMKERLEVIHG